MPFTNIQTEEEYNEDTILSTLNDTSMNTELPPVRESNTTAELERQRARLSFSREARNLSNNENQDENQNETERKYTQLLRLYVEMLESTEHFDLKNKELNKEVNDLKKELKNKEDELQNLAGNLVELTGQIQNNVNELEGIEKMDKIKTAKIEDLQKWVDTYFHLSIGLVVLLFSFAISNTFKYSSHMIS